MIKAVIFDCFGVLITDALQALSDKHAGLDPAVGRQMEDIMTAVNRGFLSRDDMFQQVADLFGYSLQELHTMLDEGEVKNTELLAYIMELRTAGLRTALLSNVGSGGLQQRFSIEELASHFDAVVASGDIGFAKPEPEAYEITADRIGVRLEECVMIDDRQVCIDGARAVGMQGICFENVARLRQELSGML